MCGKYGGERPNKDDVYLQLERLIFQSKRGKEKIGNEVKPQVEAKFGVKAGRGKDKALQEE